MICAMLCCSEVQFFGDSIMVWDGILHNAKTDFHFLHSGSVNASMYTEEGLLNYVVPYMSFVDVDLLFTLLNMYPHVAKWTLNFLEEVEIARFKRPTCNPDLNPSEHSRTG